MYCTGVASQAPATNATHSDPPCTASPARVDSRENAFGAAVCSVAIGASSGTGALARSRAGNRAAISAASSSASTPTAI